MDFLKTGFVLAASATMMLSGCATVKTMPPGAVCSKGMALIKPSAPIILPKGMKNPDSITLGPKGDIYLTINNSSDQNLKPEIVILDENDQIHPFTQLPTHPVSGKTSPLGIAFASDGNLYVADNQTFVGQTNQSRLLRVNIKRGKAVGVDVVATGLNAANGVTAFGNYVVVNDTCIDGTYPQKSGAYRFTLKQLKGAPVKVTGWNDPNLLVKFETVNKQYQVGANGAAYDRDGNLFICNFGDQEILKTTFDKKGNVVATKVFIKGQGLESVDGLQLDAYGKIWVADFIGNAAAQLCPESGALTIIAKNKPCTGEDGGLDAPAECTRRGNKVYGSNIDLTFGPNTTDDLHTISVYELP